MTGVLDEEYPEAAPYIRDAVDEHGKAWVLEHYYEQRYPLGRVMRMPEKDELPFSDAENHETMADAEKVEMYRAWAAYRENLRAAANDDG